LLSGPLGGGREWGGLAFPDCVALPSASDVRWVLCVRDFAGATRVRRAVMECVPPRPDYRRLLLHLS